MNLWNFKASFYQQTRQLFPFNLILAKERKNLKELLSNLNCRQHKILDVGAGAGSTLDLFPHNAEIFALDSSYHMLRRVSCDEIQHCVVANAHNLPFKSGSFDLVSAIGVFEYQPQPVDFLKELSRVLPPLGYLVLTYSQISFLNYLRFFSGHRLYLADSDKVAQVLNLCNFVLLAHKKSLIQTQLLIQKNAENGKKTQL